MCYHWPWHWDNKVEKQYIFVRPPMQCTKLFPLHWHYKLFFLAVWPFLFCIRNSWKQSVLKKVININWSFSYSGEKLFKLSWLSPFSVALYPETRIWLISHQSQPTLIIRRVHAQYSGLNCLILIVTRSMQCNAIGRQCVVLQIHFFFTYLTNNVSCQISPLRSGWDSVSDRFDQRSSYRK